MSAENIHNVREWIGGFVNKYHANSGNPAHPSEALIQFFRRNVPNFADWAALSGEPTESEIKVDLPKIFAKLESEGGVPAILSASEIISSTPSYGEAQASSLTCLAVMSFFLPDWNIPVSLQEPQKVSFQASENDSERFDLSRCFACDEEAGCLERIVIAHGQRLVHRRCFQCDRCHSRLRRGLYSVTGSESSKGHEKYECLRHEHEDLLSMFNKTTTEVKEETKQTEKSEESVPETIPEAPSIPEIEEEAAERSTKKPEELSEVPDEVAEISTEKPKELPEVLEEVVEISTEKPEELPEVPREAAGLDNDTSIDAAEQSLEEVALDPQPAGLDHQGGKVDIEEKPVITVQEEVIEETAQRKDSEIPEDPVSPTSGDQCTTSDRVIEEEQEKPQVELLPVAPPRRKKKGEKSRDSSGSRTQSPLPKPKPVVPPKPKSLKSHEQPKKPVEDLYPDDLNPFGSDEESDDGHSGYNSSLNPFADDDDYSSDLNPFGSESDAGSIRESDAGSIQNVRLRTQSPIDSPRTSSPHRLSLTNGSLSGRGDDTRRNTTLGITPRPTKRHAPPPPPPRPSLEVKKAEKPPRPPKPANKKRHAPPPPLPCRRTIVTEDLLSKEHVEDRLKDLDTQQKALEEESCELWNLYASAMSENITHDQVQFNVNIQQWLGLCAKKCTFLQQEAELVHQWRKHYLDELHSDIEYQLRCIIEKPDSLKTEKDSRLEARLLLLLLDVIERKNRLIESQLAPASWEDAPDRTKDESEIHDESEKAKKKKKKLKLRLKKIKKLMGDSKHEHKSSPHPAKA